MDRLAWMIYFEKIKNNLCLRFRLRSTGPKKDNLAMDLTVQAVSMMSGNYLENGPSMKAGAAACDFVGGVHQYAWI